MEAKVALRGIIETYQNDFLHGYKGEDREKERLAFLELIVAVTRYVQDYRYCSNKKCSCGPEADIKRLATEEFLNKFFSSPYNLTEVSTKGMRDFLSQFKEKE
ncbi:hypothetical protein [Bacillus weihaiensis]|uniref:hypothetical protein n=1 Tax=Bacillus weihaiensis TaxID=1547283 RepID=UPI0023566769|nr:hypothetical protein [Bacillus weihaiensis]